MKGSAILLVPFLLAASFSCHVKGSQSRLGAPCCRCVAFFYNAVYSDLSSFWHSCLVITGRSDIRNAFTVTQLQTTKEALFYTVPHSSSVGEVAAAVRRIVNKGIRDFDGRDSEDHFSLNRSIFTSLLRHVASVFWVGTVPKASARRLWRCTGIVGLET
jgi:hypothetical protein